MPPDASSPPSAPPLAVVAAVAASLLWIPQAYVLAGAVAAVVEGRLGAGGLVSPIALFLLLALLRAGLDAGSGLLAARAATAARRALRHAAAAVTARFSPVDAGRPAAGDVAALAADQAEALEPFVTRYAPARWRMMTVPPVIALAIALESWVSALILCVAFPIIPVLQSLIGAEARALSRRQLDAVGSFNGVLLDRLDGLTTIRLFGAVPRVAASVAEAGDLIRRRTMAVLRLAFLSSAVLELFAAIGVALVAIHIGFVLMGWMQLGGPLTLAGGLFVLLLAPDFFQPLRDFAAAYHDRAAADALAARAADLIDPARPAIVGAGGPGGPGGMAAPNAPGLVFDGVVGPHGGAGAPIDLVVAPGERVALYGPSGAGKSTLIALAAGLVAPVAGRVAIDGRTLDAASADDLRALVGWVGQTPLVLPASLADNAALIAPGASVAAIRAALGHAALGDVLARLPAGLETPLGETGAGLSGGELRRLALARVLLAGRPLVLADEPTASLDPDTAAKVRDALDRLADGRTLVVATHDPLLAARMDRIVDLDAGAVVGERRPDRIDGTGAPCRAPVSSAATVTGAVSADRPCGMIPSAAAPFAQPAPLSSAAPSQADRSLAAPSPTEVASSTTPDPAAEPGGLGLSALRVVLARFLALAPGRLAAGLGLLVVTVAAGTGLLAASGALIAGSALAGAGLIVYDSFRPSAAIRAAALLRTVARYGERVVGHDATLASLAALRVDVFRGLAAAEAIRPARRGADGLARLSGDLDALDGLHLKIAAPVAVAVLLLAAAAVGLALLSPSLALLVVAPAALAGLLLPLAGGLAAGGAVADRHRALDALRAAVVALDRGRVDFAVAGRLPDSVAAVTEEADRVALIEARLQRRDQGLRAVSLLAGQAAIAGALAGMAPLVAAGAITPMTGAGVVLAAFALGEILQPVRIAAFDVGRVLLAARRLAPLLAAPAEPADPPPGEAAPAIDVEAVDHGYGGGADARRVFVGLTLAVAPGEHVALVGPSGSGKSTLLALVAGLARPDRGRVLVGGAPLARPGLSASGVTVGLLTQRTELFAGTVAEALRLADPKADDDRLWQALAAARLDGVVAERGGLAMQLGDGGAGLSGGERRRLALARLLVAPPQVILLDEPTEGLDAATARDVLAALGALAAGRTLVVATHRPAEAALADRVIRLDALGA